MSTRQDATVILVSFPSLLVARISVSLEGNCRAQHHRQTDPWVGWRMDVANTR